MGAIYIEPEIATSDPSLAHQLADIGLHHLWKACPGWDKIRLYSSIFSEPGEKFAFAL